MKHKISFDCDGILAGGHYLPAWDRQPEVYRQLPLRDYAVPNILNKLMSDYHVYIISGRRFDGATEVTKEWLALNNIDVHNLAGIVTGVQRLLKPVLVELMGIGLHVDDDPLVCQRLGCRGVNLVNKEWLGYEDLETQAVQIHNWSEVEGVIEHHFAPMAKQLELFAT